MCFHITRYSSDFIITSLKIHPQLTGCTEMGSGPDWGAGGEARPASGQLLLHPAKKQRLLPEAWPFVDAEPKVRRVGGPQCPPLRLFRRVVGNRCFLTGSCRDGLSLCLCGQSLMLQI